MLVEHRITHAIGASVAVAKQESQIIVLEIVHTPWIQPRVSMSCALMEAYIPYIPLYDVYR